MTSQQVASPTTEELEARRARALQIAQTCAQLLRERFGAQRVIIFGSVVGPMPWHEQSDIDIAVEGLTDDHFWQAYGVCLDLAQSNGFDFDLVELETAPPRLRARILGEVDMPDDPLLRLKQLIEDEFSTLEIIIEDVESALAQFADPTNPKQYEMQALGSYLHQFYNGIEGILERIATQIDRHVPRGEHSHAELLQQMSEAQGDLRPAVVDSVLWFQLDELRRFRNFFRHAYGHKLIWEKLRRNVEAMRPVLAQLRAQLTVFFEQQTRGK